MNKRSTEKELLDDPSMPFEEIQRNMKELNTINSWLGGHAITRSGLRRLIKGHSGLPLTVLEIGCGGGDNLKAIGNWSLTTTIKLRLMGVDINPACISFAEKEFPAASYQVADYRMLRLNEPVDILFSSLFCHHFTDEELVMQLKWMYQHCKRGFFINDLHRNPIAYYSIRVLTGLFSRSRLVKHDAPLSVKRGFRKSEWNNLLQQAEIPVATIRWRWAFRWLIVVKKSLHDR